MLSSLYGVRHDDTTYTHCRAAHHAFEYGLAHSPGGRGGHHDADAERHKQSPRIKKPLNAFMLFMKEMRPKVIEECSLKESAAINQILGRKVSACCHCRRQLMMMTSCRDVIAAASQRPVGVGVS